MSPEDVQTLELLARGGAVGALIGLAVVMLRGPSSPARATGVLFCLAATGHTLTQYPPVMKAFGLAAIPVWAFSVMGAGLFWAFTTELFGDRRRLEPLRFIPALLLLTIGSAAAFSDDGVSKFFLLVHNLVGGGLMIHVLFVVWSGWRGDLVESRRRLRGPILAAGALYAVAVIGVQISEVLWRPASDLSPLAAIVLFSLGLASLGALLRADADLFAAQEKTKAAEARSSAPSLSHEDARVVGKLDELMQQERIYRHEGLSIGALAGKLGVPEYKLRRIINQRLGYRNFSAFLNERRLSEAKEALSDPAQREVPISTIALDAGFQSLGPFNRSFRTDTGLTPTDYRAKALGAGEAAGGHRVGPTT